MKKRHVYLIATDPFHPTVLFAATTFGILATNDGGAHWRIAHRGLGGGHVVSLIIEVGPPGLLYAATSGENGGVFRSADRGHRWERMTAGMH